MLRAFLVLLLLTGSTLINVSAQPTDFTAPINWETYSDRELGFSLSLPKLPLKDESSDVCNNVDRTIYYAYAENVVYRVEVLRKTKSDGLRSWCQQTASFDSTKYFDQVGRRFGLSPVKGENGLPMLRAVKEDGELRVFHDEARKRLIELSVTQRAGANGTSTPFLGSLVSDRKIKGKEIGNGSEQVLGDQISEQVLTGAPAPVKAPDQNKTQGSGQDSGFGDGKGGALTAYTNPYKVIFQPKARYTNAARQSGVQGSVLLKITLLSNGKVGKITPVKELDGLTEQAIGAARRMAFLPKQVNGVNVPVVISREYTFSIY